jgi:hypothetical protein
MPHRRDNMGRETRPRGFSTVVTYGGAAVESAERWRGSMANGGAQRWLVLGAGKRS